MSVMMELEAQLQETFVAIAQCDSALKETLEHGRAREEVLNTRSSLYNKADHIRVALGALYARIDLSL